MPVSVSRRLAAAAALVLLALTVLFALSLVINELPRSPFVVLSAWLALIAGAYGIVRRGMARVVGLMLAALLLLNLVISTFEHSGLLPALVVIGALLTSAAASAALRVRVSWPRAPAPERPVLFWNPRSGDGKAERFGLAAAARERGIEPIELTPGADLETLARAAVGRGADALAMAGGDGSQAVVAAVAAEHGLPYACIPAGTRNHFALDLGVDRDDVVGALDAFVDGGERRVDLAEVNGRVFVNNVSLGLYAEAVQHDGYRDAKLRTILDTVPDVLGSSGGDLDLHWHGPGGQEHRSGAAILVSNNRYRLGRAVGSGTRPRIDDGLLGITVFGGPSGRGAGGRGTQRMWREWSAPSFEVDADRAIPAGVDGEALVLEAPLRFRIRPGVLRVRIARRHPGASPSANAPEGPRDALHGLLRIALGREQETQPTRSPTWT
jgi:hypothetical protein